MLAVWGVRPDGSCRCRPARPRRPCPCPGKHPIGSLAPNGVHGATRDLSTVEAWFAEYPTANLAAACGQRMIDGRYLVVLDIDPRNGGLISALGAYPDTVRSVTPGGGVHAYYGSAAPIGKGSLGAGLDLQGAGAYVVAPGSSHASGGTYAWDAGAHPDDVSIASVEIIGAPRRPLARPRSAHGDAADTWLGVAFGVVGWLGEPLRGGKRMARCPWADEHSDDRGHGSDDSCVLLAPARGYARVGAWSCRHGHCSQRTIGDVLATLPQAAWDAASKRYPVELAILRRAAA
ncbi:MAG: bifunctional DNA primase/polymerase [Labilithrix sp.]|nr:bifunctional DNA primase/polymerase [Labilithrix sp.]